MNDDYGGLPPMDDDGGYEQQPRPAQRPIVCLRCRTRVGFSQIRLLDEVAPGIFHVLWECACGLRESMRSQLAPGDVARLLDGFTPRLPYTASELPAVPLDNAAEADVAKVASAFDSFIATAADFAECCELDAERHSHGS